MLIKKRFNTYRLIIILILCLFTFRPYAYADAKGSFEVAGTLEDSWADISSLIPLNDGNAFILQSSGWGRNNRYSVYDSVNNKMVASGTLKQKYGTTGSPKAILLNNGKILIIGSLMKSRDKSSEIPTITYGELYDPSNNELSFTEPNLFSTFSFDMIKLLDGRVLITGGAYYYKKIQIYEPNTNNFYPTDDLNEGRYGHSSALLKNGDVLIVGGHADNGEILDSKSLKTTKTIPFQTYSYGKAAKTITLNDGRVFITCIKSYPSLEFSGNGNTLRSLNQKTKGYDTDYPGAYMALYNPETQNFKELQFHSKKKIQDYDATLLKDGRILITGGKILDGKNWVVLNTAEIFDPKTNKFIPVKNKMKIARYDHTTTTLENGDVLIVGGRDNKKIQLISEMEIFRPSK